MLNNEWLKDPWTELTADLWDEDHPKTWLEQDGLLWVLGWMDMTPLRERLTSEIMDTIECLILELDFN